MNIRGKIRKGKYYPVSIEAELTKPPLAVALQGLAGEVPDVVNVALVTLGVNLQVGNPRIFLEISEPVNTQGEGGGDY